jgi:hypothetical protein
VAYASDVEDVTEEAGKLLDNYKRRATQINTIPGDTIKHNEVPTQMYMLA